MRKLFKFLLLLMALIAIIYTFNGFINVISLDGAIEQKQHYVNTGILAVVLAIIESFL